MIGATVVGTMIGVTSILALQGMKEDKKTKHKELKLQKQRDKHRKKVQNNLIEEFLKDAD